jgi:hypothetical protein
VWSSDLQSDFYEAKGRCSSDYIQEFSRSRPPAVFDLGVYQLSSIVVSE